MFRWLRREERTVLVYQMSKVGSTAITQSLGKRVRGYAVRHLHFLNPENIAAVERFVARHGADVPQHIKDSRRIGADLASGKLNAKNTRIITLTRDPVARDVSSFMMNQDNYAGEFDMRRAQSEAIQRCAERYLARLPDLMTIPDSPYVWFEAELKQMLGIDVYSVPFPKEIGYAVYEGVHPPLLVLRSEDIDRCASEAVCSFLGLDRFTVVPSNVATDKARGAFYRRFLQTLRLPASFLDQVYGSRYVRHFYADEEIQAFRARWESDEDTPSAK